MNWLADENVHAGIVSWFRDMGDQVLFAAESLRQDSDDDLLERARFENRLLLTCDRDFGELVFRQRLINAGIVLLRLERISISARIETLDRSRDLIFTRALGNFLVFTPGKVRIRPMR